MVHAGSTVFDSSTASIWSQPARATTNRRVKQEKRMDFMTYLIRL